MTWREVFRELGVGVASRSQLVASGATGRMLTAAVRAGHLLRLRRDRYALPDLPRPIAEAVRVGGILACTSALRHHGVFGADPFTHVHLPGNAGRLRSPRSRAVRFAEQRDGIELHWRPLLAPAAADDCAVGVVDALAQALRCQPPVLAVASIDNALFLRKVTVGEVRRMLATMPRSVRRLGRWIDARSEAGQETVLRRLVHEAGLPYEVQVTIPGVGRVDLLVAGCLILEADSRLAHAGWEAAARDRRRDLVAASLGFRTLRPTYEHTMLEPELVLAAILRALR
ncbi:MAG TPA: hypothetical protein VN200_11365 [Rhodoglobus sp.]|nr:hypothetical protein [Rhodoglobus sp.]